MITVLGTATLRVKYSVQLDMTGEQFDALSHKQQDEALDNNIDWKSACRDAKLDDIEVDDVVEKG